VAVKRTRRFLSEAAFDRWSRVGEPCSLSALGAARARNRNKQPFACSDLETGSAESADSELSQVEQRRCGAVVEERSLIIAWFVAQHASVGEASGSRPRWFRIQPLAAHAPALRRRTVLIQYGGRGSRARAGTSMGSESFVR
jgi:hypothetical protein